MEHVYQFVDDVIEGGATIFAPLPMISGTIRKPAFRNSGPLRVWPMRWKRKAFN
ncbi:Uncharacterised protein [Klebsiella michiganensis]|uniref:Uncharacterized protein n=1 Tax=Klebsiella michiganensis TaxID=1134687 RepID=A0A7H4PLZ5_9ENTR|nr:Uncharacterised protein [Klebsiella michiganensis]